MRGFVSRGGASRALCRLSSSLSPPSSRSPCASTSAASKESFVVPGGQTGKTVRLDAFLSTKLAERNLSRARIQESVRAGTATVNGQVQVKPAYKLRPGDEVACEILERPPLDVEPEDIPLDVVYEDEDILVVDKPAGLVVHPAPGNHSGTLVNAVLHHCNLPALRVVPEATDEVVNGEDAAAATSPRSEGRYRESELMYGRIPVPRPGIVHRLDKGTSGLMVVAKGDLARESLQAQFRDRTVERKYLSVLGGGPLSESEGRVVTAIGRDRRERTRMAAYPVTGIENKPHLKMAASTFAVQRRFDEHSLVSWRLETGRTHQIRVHAKYLGHPLVGDETYGGQRSAEVGRPALHAATLGLDHPRTGERLRFETEPPEDFARLVATLEGA